MPLQMLLQMEDSIASRTTPKGGVTRRVSRPSEGETCEAYLTGSRRRSSQVRNPLTEERPGGPPRWGEPCACPERTL
jgi:hypothetical protein